MLVRWAQRLIRGNSAKPFSRRRLNLPAKYRPALEVLECRLAPASITPANVNISALTNSTNGTGVYTLIAGPVYTETGTGNVGVGTIILDAPAGFQFDTGGTAPNVLLTGSATASHNINNLASGSTIAATVTSSAISVTISATSSNGVQDTLTWQNIRVLPTNPTTNVAAGNLTIDPASTSSLASVTKGSTSFGALAEVADGFIQTVGTGSSAIPGATFAVTVPPRGVVAGDTVIGEIDMNQGGVLSSVTDSAGNTYAIDATVTNATAPTAQNVIFSGKLANALAPGGSITLNFSTTPSRVGVSISEFAGIAGRDQFASAIGATLTVSSGATATSTVQPDELLIGSIATNNNASTLTPGTGFTALAPQPITGDTGSILPEYQIVSATGNYAATGTLIGAQNWAAAIVTYKFQIATTASIALTSGTSPSTFGNSLTFTATIANTFSASPPAGTVQFFDGATSLGNGTALAAGPGGTATSTFTINNLPAGATPHSITAKYTGTQGFGNSATSALNQTVDAATTSTAVTNPANPSVFGQSTTFTATVTNTGSSITPNGTVEFFDGATDLGPGSVLAGALNTATSTITLPNLSLGSHSITASFSDPLHNLISSTSPIFSQTVNAAATSTALSSSDTSAVFGEAVTFTATISATLPGSGTPTGSVQFQVDGVNFGAAVMLVGGVATSGSISTLAVTSHTITATYSGDTDFITSTNTLTQSVGLAGTTTAVTSGQNPSVFGQGVTFTATVSAVLPGAGTPGGTVEFFAGATSLGIVALSGGTASVNVATLSVGNHSITAVFTDTDGHFNGSNATGITQTVNKAATTTSAVGGSPSPSVYGQAVTFTATITANSPGAGIPTGIVTFFDGASALGTGNVSGAGVATFTTTNTQLAAGSHLITASYGGDADFTSSTDSSSPTTQVVNKTSTTTSAVGSSLNPSIYGQQVTFTATITAVQAGAGVPTGTVTFFDGASSIGTGTVNASGVATFTTTNTQLLAAAHDITASYGGDSNDASSNDSALPHLSQTVNASATTTTGADKSVTFDSAGQNVTLTASVTAVTPGSIVNEGTFTFTIFNSSNVQVGGPVTSGTVTGGAASATFALPGIAGQGTFRIDVTYNPGSDYLTSSDSTHHLTVAAANTTTTAANKITTFSSTNQSLVFTAVVAATTGLGKVNEGTVTFTVLDSGNNPVGSAAVSSTVTNGNASATYVLPGGSPSGTYTIVATYNPGTDYNGSSDNSKTLTVNLAGSSTAVSSSSPTIIFGQGVTFTATVSSSAGIPTGTVTFFDGATQLGSAIVVNAGGSATTPVIALTAGTHTITATYSGDSNYTGSTSPPFTQTVNKADTATVAANQTAITGSVNQNVTLSATVTATTGGSIVNEGTVTFAVFNGATQIGASVTSGTVSVGAASVTYVMPADTPNGTYSIHATYNPGADYKTSNDNAHTLVVSLAGTTTTVANQTAIFGSANQNVTLSAVVAAIGGAGSVNQGTVTFAVFNGATQIGTSVISATVSGGNASVTYVLPANTPNGTYTIHATYNPGADYTGSTDNTHTLTVSQAGTTTTAVNQTATFDSAAQNVTLSAVVAGGAGTVNQGTVTFTVFQGATQIGTSVTSVTVSGGNASVTYVLPGGTAAGSYTIHATYNPGPNYTGSSDLTHTLTVNPVGTTTLAANQTATFDSANQNVTLSALVTANSGTGSVNEGTVTFAVFNGATQIGSSVTSATVSGGTASVTFVLPGSTPNGTYSIHATYNAGPDYSTSNDLTHQLTVGQAATSTTVANQTAIFGSTNQNVTLSAVVAALSGTGTVNEGTVTFKVFQGAVQIGATVTSATVSGGNASATFVLPANTPNGTYSIQATYNPGADYTGSSDNTHTLTLNQAGSTTTVANQTAIFGSANQNVTLSAVVAAIGGAGSVNQGTVTFSVFQGVVQVGASVTSTTVSGGNASVTYVLPANTPNGTYTIQATYNPGADYTGSTDNTHTLTVNQAGTTTTAVNQTVTFDSANQNVPLAAVVAAIGGAGTVNQGTVTFTVFQGATQIGASVTSTTVSGGNAGAMYVMPGGTAIGTYTIVATYNPGADYLGSSDNAHMLSVSAAGSSIGVVSSLPISVFGEAVTFTATITSSAGVPTGNVTFFDGATALGTVATSGGQATLTTGTLLVGSSPHTITASYSDPAGNFGGSTSAAITQTVNKADTTTVVTSSGNPSVFGQLVTFTATISAVLPGAGIPAGNVQFQIDGVNFGGPVTLSGGQATVSTGALSVGPHTITASFSDTDGNFNASDDLASPFTQNVNLSGVTTVVAPTSGSNPSLFGQSLTFTATVTAAGLGAGTPTGTVTFFDNGVAIGTTTLNGVSGNDQASFSTPDLLGGSHSITVTYNGDTNFLPVVSGAIGQTVNASIIALTVNTLTDTTAIDGQLALREAVDLTNGTLTISRLIADGAVITPATAGAQQFNISFSAGLTGTIALTGGELSLVNQVSITGAGSGGVTLSGSNLSRVFNIAGLGVVTLDQLTLADGLGTNGGDVANAGNLNLTGDTIMTGAATQGGGVYSTGTLTVSNSTFTANSAASGGAIYSSGGMTLTDDTISANRAGISGAGSGGGIFTITAGTLVNTIVAGNFVGTGTSASDISGSLNTTASHHNFIGDAGSSGGLKDISIDAAHANIVGVNGSGTANPMLGALANNGGLTKTMALLPGSLAINSGDPTPLIAVDQRGAPRTAAVGFDIGAYQKTAATKLVVTFAPSIVAGVATTVYVSAVDANGNAGFYVGTIDLTTSDTNAILPASLPYTFIPSDRSIHSFTFTFKTAGTQTVTAKDTSNTVTANTGTCTVLPNVATSMVLVTQPSTTVAGVAMSPAVVVQLLDQFGNVATTNTSAVTVQLIVPSGVTGATLSGTLTVNVVNGVATFSDLSITKAATGYELFFKDGTLVPLFSNTFDIVAAAATKLLVTPAAGFSQVVAAGLTYSFVVTAVDKFGNTVTTFADHLGFATASVPPDVFSSSNPTTLVNGTNTFTATINFAGVNGANFITATDLNNAGITGTLVLQVNSQPTALLQTTLLLPASPNVVAGTVLTIVVTALTSSGIVNANFTNTIHFTSTDPQAVLPADYTFTTGVAGDNGTHTFTGVILETSGFQGPGDQIIVAGDALSHTLGVTITVSPAAATQLGVLYPAVTTPNTNGALIVRALDQYGNIDPTYTGIITLTFAYAGGSGTASVNLPDPFNFSGSSGDKGSRSFSVSLTAVGSYTISASGELGATTITGTDTVIVEPAPTRSVADAGVVSAATANPFALQSLITQSTTTQFSITPQTTVIISTSSPLVVQANNRVIAGSSTNSPITVELDAGVPNPAIGMVISGTAGEFGNGEIRADEEFSLDASLLPVILTRRSIADQMSAPDKMLWPAAALMSFSEGGVWAVMATFLPDSTTGPNNPPPANKSVPAGQTRDELENMLRDRSAPATGPAIRGPNLNSGVFLEPAPVENWSGTDQSAEVSQLWPSTLTPSAVEGADDASMDSPSDWMLVVATSLAAAGITTLPKTSDTQDNRKAQRRA